MCSYHYLTRRRAGLRPPNEAETLPMHTTLITVDGLESEDCVHEITNVIHELPGINMVEVALATGTVSVEHSPLVSEADIRQALEDEGYALK